MRLTRCYVDTSLQPGTEIALPGRAADHLLKVLRLRAGDACVLFNGDGRDCAARIVAADRRQARAEILDARPVGNESPLRITLLQGVARREKMDLILQKATELGVAGLRPVIGERTEVRLDAQRAEKRLAHWRSVVVAACEQSGRSQVPGLAPPQPLAAALAALAPGGLRLLLDPEGEHAIGALSAPDGEVLVAIGPEGGWSARDRAALRASGFRGLRLGPRVLRTETAGLAAIAALQARWGDL